MYYLLISDQDRQFRYNLSQGEITIGRNEDCNIILTSAAVSRKHAKIYTDGPFCFLLEDLNSTNGTYINEQKLTKPSYLIHGNSISIGHATLKFIDEEYALLEDAEHSVASTFHSRAVEKKVAPLPMEAMINIKNILQKVDTLNSKIPATSLSTNVLKQSLTSISNDLLSLLGIKPAQQVNQADISKPEPGAVPPSPAEVNLKNAEPGNDKNKAMQDLPAVTKDKKIDNEVYECALADIRMVSEKVDDYKKNCYFILSVAMKIMNLNRGFIVVKEPIEGAIQPLITKINSNEILEGMPSILLAKYCITDCSVVMVSDPALDERFAGKSESIRSGHIKAAICAPLQKDQKCLGAIYLDSTESPKAFSENEQIFIEKIAEQISQILINSQIFDKIVGEYETIDSILSKVGRKTEELEKILKYIILEDVRSKISAIESFSKNSTAEIINILKENLALENNRALIVTYLKIISTIGDQTEYEFIKKYLNHKDIFIKSSVQEILNRLEAKAISKNTENNNQAGCNAASDGNPPDISEKKEKLTADDKAKEKQHISSNASILDSDLELYDDFKVAINYINKKVDSGAQLKKVMNAIKANRK